MRRSGDFFLSFYFIAFVKRSLLSLSLFIFPPEPQVFFNTAAIPPELFYQILISPSITLEAYFIPLFPSPFLLNSLNFSLNHYIPHLVEYVPMIDTKTIK